MKHREIKVTHRRDTNDTFGVVDECTFGVTRLPNRKSACLYVMRGAMLEPLAYFRGDDDADRFCDILDFVGAAMQDLIDKSKGDDHG